MDESLLQYVIPLGRLEQKVYLDEFFPIDVLNVEEQVRIIRQNLQGMKGVEYGAGVVCYAGGYSTNPAPGAVRTHTIMNSTGQTVNPLFNKIE